MLPSRLISALGRLPFRQPQLFACPVWVDQLAPMRIHPSVPTAFSDICHCLQWFDSIDVSRDGSLDGKELQRALALGNLHFSLQTVAHMIRFARLPGRQSAHHGHINRLQLAYVSNLHQPAWTALQLPAPESLEPLRPLVRLPVGTLRLSSQEPSTCGRLVACGHRNWMEPAGREYCSHPGQRK